ncbi:MAG: ATP-binding protein [Candidatus Woesearchaeota archaeon]
MFIGRTEELGFLKGAYESDRFENIVIYGRRRVGKTSLCTEFLKTRNGTYFLAQKTREQPQALTNKFAREKNIFPEETKTFHESFRFIKKHIKGRYVIAIDEFPFLIQEDKTIPSQFQSIIDEELQDTSIMLILLGSSVSIMEDEVLAHKSPLYGRRTGQMKINPFSLPEIIRFFPRKTMKELIEIYGVLDGIPAYLNQFEQEKSTLQNIKERILEKEQYLFEEVDFLLNQELREPKKYKAILEAISKGKNRLSEIANEAGLKVTILPRYLETLETLQIITRKHSIHEKQMSRNTIYDFRDNFFRFYFRFIYPNLMLLEERRADVVLQEIEDGLQQYLGSVFEEVCKEYLIHTGSYRQVGSYFAKGEEIDIVGIASSHTLLGECKYKEDVEHEKVLETLQRKNHPFTGKLRYEVFAKSFKEKEQGIDLNKIYKEFAKGRTRRK